ncbi:MAG TPA: glutathione-independent formaldehyde dehydrogenase [Planctomycetota bacterium]
MKALVYEGPSKVAVREVPDAKLERPGDVLVRVTATNICGSDLHMYEGRTDMEEGRVLGHENLGEVIEVGEAVEHLEVGDWVCLPFNVSCGFCRNCEGGLTGACLAMNPDNVGAAYGFAGMGPFEGGQAEYLRVPHADFNCLKLPPDVQEKEADYVMLADILPTGYHAVEMARVQPGESVIIYGAGPVGLMATLSAFLKGASKVIVVDRFPDRLDLARQLGAITIDFASDDAVEQVLHHTDGRGADKGCECVGYQAHDPQGQEQPDITMNNLVASVRATGRIGVVGVFVPEDPKAQDKLEKKGQIAFDWGKFWMKGLQLGTGQANVKAYNRQLRELIRVGKIKPSLIVSHELPLEDAPDAYEKFNAREKGWTKVILKPAGVASSRGKRKAVAARN